MNNVWLLYLLFGMVSFGLGEYFSKIYANNLINNLTNWLVPIIIICYMFGTFMWLGIMKNNNQLALMSTIWCTISLLIGVFLGVFIFKETLTTIQWVGVTLALISIYLLIK